MNNSKIKRSIFAVAIVAALTAIVLICFFLTNTNDSAQVQENLQTQNVENGLQNIEKQDKSRRIVKVMASIAYMDIDELMQGSSLIISGKLEKASSAFEVESVDGGIRVYTDYYIKPTKIYREASKEQEKKSEFVTVRIEGGETKSEIVEVESAPKLEYGKEYLLFLYHPNMGGSFNTKGDYYYVLGAQQGVFYKSENPQDIKLDILKDVKSNESIFINSFVSAENGLAAEIENNKSLNSGKDNVFSYVIVEKDFASQIEKVNEITPVDIDYFKKQLQKNLESNLENDFISKEEYDDTMEGIKKYATIVE